MNPPGSDVNDLEQTIRTLIQDPLLSDVPNPPSEQVLDDLIALELGQAYKIHIQRGALPSFVIIIGQACTVRDIKKKVEQAWKDTEHSRKISWKYIWRTYCLEWKLQRLTNDKTQASQLGLEQDATLRFVRLNHDKHSHKKAWRRPH